MKHTKELSSTPLTHREVQIVISALLFSSSVDVIGHFDDDISLEMVEIVERILGSYQESTLLDFSLIEVFGNPKNFEQREISKRIKKLLGKYGK